MSWLAPVAAALAEAPAPVTFFFRDDDAGWRDDRLRRLLELFDRFSTRSRSRSLSGLWSDCGSCAGAVRAHPS